MLNIGISLKRNYYTPEAYAYKSFLEKKGWSVQLDYEEFLLPENDITILFLGIDLFWKKNKFKRVIHDYPGVSTGKFPKIRNIVKKNVNRIPDGRIFFDDFVGKEFGFKDCTKSINVNAGVDQLFFEKGTKVKEYDLVYSGAISGRDGFSLVLHKIAGLGLKILIIGDVDKSFRECFKSYKNIVFIGRVGRSELPKLYRSAKAGLNFTPNAYPYHFQPSIKVFEYLASGIGVVTTHSVWADKFYNKHEYKPLWLENLKTRYDFDSFEFSELDMSEYRWDVVLKEAKFEEFLKSRLDTTKG
jgi:glycosyltransferase involved in cell wall biosynthesis